MEFINSASGDCCNPTQGFQLCGCADGVAYIQLVVVGTTGSNTVWLNTETGATETAKPVGFLTGNCSDAASKDTLRFSSAAPTATTPFASPLDGHTTIVTSDGTEAGTVTAYWRYDAETATWKEIPIPKALLWVDVATAPAATGNAVGPRFELTPSGAKFFIDSNGRAEKIDTKIDVNLTPVSFTPTATGNTTNLGQVVVDPAGVIWIIDEQGDAMAMTFPVYKELNQFHVDKNGNDTTGIGADEKPFLTVSKALTLAAAGDAVVVAEGSYSEAVTMSVANTTLRGEGNEYGVLTEINSLSITTASGTSNRVSSLLVTGNVSHSGGAPLFLSDVTINGNYASSSTAYDEIRQTRIQGGTVSKTGAGTLFIVDSLIGTSTFSTAGSVISLRNVNIDPGETVTIGAGVIYALEDVVGNIVIDPAAIPAATAALAGGLTGDLAKDVEVSTFNDIRLTNVPTISTATKVLVRDARGVVSEQNIAAPDFAQVVYVNATSPATATIFDLENPPVTNDNALKNLENAIYIGTDGSQWTSDGAAYKTYTPSCRPKVKVITANYTLTAADEGYLIYVNSTAAVTVTAPANLPAGFIAELYQENTGQVTAVAGAGNTLRSANGFKTRVRNSAIGISYQTTALSNVVGDSTV